MTGWCPRHDRVFEADDGLCPKCGTALVVDDAPTRSEVIVIDTIDDEAPEADRKAAPRSASRNALVAIAAAVVVAFVAGLAFPRNDKPAAPTARPRDVVSELNVGVTRSNGNLPIRLESFTQRGRNLVARFTVADPAAFDLGNLQGVQVFFTLAGGGEISDNVAPRTTVSGFVIAGTFLQRADIPVTGVRIDELIFGGATRAEASIDISDSWPASIASEPRASSLNIAMSGGPGRTLRFTGLVGWADRLEVGVSASGGRPGFVYDTRYELVSASSYPGVPLQTAAPMDGKESFTVRFNGLPRKDAAWKLRVTVERSLAIGPWEWSFI